MRDFDFRIPTVIEELGNKASMAFMRLVLTAQKTPLIEKVGTQFFIDFSRVHEVEKLSFVYGPSPLLFLECGENFVGWRKQGFVEIVDFSDDAKEVTNILAFSEPG